MTELKCPEFENNYDNITFELIDMTNDYSNNLTHSLKIDKEN